jgi:hypothetical protein
MSELGAWVVPTPDWRTARHPACDLCGRPLTGRRWEVASGRTPGVFCDAGCERLYLDYWIPRHGRPSEPG